MADAAFATGKSPTAARAGSGERPFQRLGPVKSVAGTLAATGALLGPAYLSNLVRPRAVGKAPQLWHRMVSRSLGVSVSMRGECASGSVLYVSNHLSWLDIPVLGSKLHGAFVAKAEVGQMGFVGFLADMQRTIYVERARRSESVSQAGSIQERLQRGDNVILFPEGTSNDGVRLLPFKSTLFSVTDGAAMAGVRIQPIALAYTHLNGLPLTRSRLMEIAWVGDMALGSHAMDLMRLGSIRAEIVCHPPVRRADFADRKALARHCHQLIAASYQSLMRGEA
jgi:lyso-ornithine lipid O-acyltransferase